MATILKLNTESRKSFDNGNRLLREPEVRHITGKSHFSIWTDPDFPKPIKIGKRAVAWLQSDLDDWLNRQAEKSAAIA
ncbi:MAG: AlpA family phage regulatory protein [Oxalobacter sp.]|nr:AlpA family phage regulatory protein [Oxalobacter sp.]